MTRGQLTEALRRFETYKATYRGLQNALVEGSLEDLMEDVEVNHVVEKDFIYVKNVQLQLTITGQIRICHQIAIAPDVEIDESRLELEDIRDCSVYHPEIHYWLNIPWSRKGTSETGIVSTGVIIDAGDIINGDFIGKVYPSLQDQECGYVSDGTDQVLEIYVLLEPDLYTNVFVGVDLFNRPYPYKEKPVKVDTTPLAGVLAHPDYSEVMHQLEEHLATGMELKKKLQKLLEDPFAGGGWKNKGEEGQDA